MMTFIKSLLFLFFVTLIEFNDCSPLETNCTKVESIDGSVGVDCHRTRQASDKFEPTIIDQHFVELFARSKRSADVKKPEEQTQRNQRNTTRATRETKPEEQTQRSQMNKTRATRETKPEEQKLQISELFIQNLAVMAQANMSDCMDRVNCEEKCQLIAEGVLKETEEDTKEMEGIKELPQFVGSFYEAGKRGIELGKKGKQQCSQCKQLFSKCNQMQYDYTIKTNALYKELMDKNITLFDDSDPNEEIPQEIAYLHHSMRFLDLANLSRCYARVSCEATCRHVKMEPNSEAPPMTSPLLENDPKKPKSVDIIHEGALLGYTLAFNGVCDTCSLQYADCPSDRYSIANTSSLIFG